MGQYREPGEQVCHLVRLHNRGIICPSEMWLSIADVLTPATATAVLDALPDDVKELLRTGWLERPPVAYIRRSDLDPGGGDFQLVCAEVVRWCEANGPPPEITDEADWLIRVRAEDNFVREWQHQEERGSA